MDAVCFSIVINATSKTSKAILYTFEAKKTYEAITSKRQRIGGCNIIYVSTANTFYKSKNCKILMLHFRFLYLQMKVEKVLN